MKKLYFFLLIGFIGNTHLWATAIYDLDSSVSISYPTPICASSPNVPVIMIGSGNYLGGTFSSSAGLMLNAVNGSIVPSASAPGTYIITYDVPANITTGDPSISASFAVTIVSLTVPVFIDIVPSCNPQSPPTTSINGISGTWLWSQTTVINVITTTYTFDPNPGACAASLTESVSLMAPITPVITTNTDNNTVYVDGNTNEVVAGLTLSSDIPDGYASQWFEDGVMILGATLPNYVISTASTNGEDRVFTVEKTDVETGCSSMSTEFVVSQSSGTPPPLAPRYQNFVPGSTLADVVVSGSGIQWYDSATNKNANTSALPLSTLLVDNTTYYASQTVNGSESLERFPVTVYLTLGIGENELVSLTYSPNPVKNSLTIKTENIINSTSIVNLLGQVLKTTAHNEAEIVEDMSVFSSGTYFVRVTSGNKTEVFKIVKE